MEQKHVPRSLICFQDRSGGSGPGLGRRRSHILVPLHSWYLQMLQPLIRDSRPVPKTLLLFLVQHSYNSGSEDVSFGGAPPLVKSENLAIPDERITKLIPSYRLQV